MAVSDLRARVRESGFVHSWRLFATADPGLLSGAVAYNVFFSLAPLMLALLAVASLIGRDEEIRTELLEGLASIAPPEVVDFVAEALDSAAAALAGAEGLVIVFSLILALYSGSRATYAILRALTLIERRPDSRPFWKRRLIGVALTVLGGAAFIVALMAVVIGTTLVSEVGGALDLTFVEAVSSTLSLPVVALALFVYLASVYRYGPPVPLTGSWFAALMGTVGAIIASWAFGLFLSATGGLGGVVGAVATLAVLLVWLYLGAYIIFLSAFAAGELRRPRTQRGEGGS